MSTRSPLIRVADFDVDVVRKDIKNLHVGVYPPFGRVRVATPPLLDDEAVRLAVIAKLPWIKKKRLQMQRQARQPQREMVEGETHYVWGRPFRLRLSERPSRNAVELRPDGRLVLHSPSGPDPDARLRRLNNWYRNQLRGEAAALLEEWAPRIGVSLPEWGIRRMKTKWGTCTRESGRIWINLELVQKDRRCLEFIIVHELVHLIEKNHTDRFFDLMTKFMPDWESRREELNSAPLAFQRWAARTEVVGG